MEEASAKLDEHIKAVHDYGDEQLSGPKTMKAIRWKR